MSDLGLKQASNEDLSFQMLQLPTCICALGHTCGIWRGLFVEEITCWACHASNVQAQSLPGCETHVATHRHPTLWVKFAFAFCPGSGLWDREWVASRDAGNPEVVSALLSKGLNPLLEKWVLCTGNLLYSRHWKYYAELVLLEWIHLRVSLGNSKVELAIIMHFNLHDKNMIMVGYIM